MPLENFQKVCGGNTFFNIAAIKILLIVLRSKTSSPWQQRRGAGSTLTLTLAELLKCGAGEDSSEFLGLQGDQSSQS